jgi:hypothetical protein
MQISVPHELPKRPGGTREQLGLAAPHKDKSWTVKTKWCSSPTAHTGAQDAVSVPAVPVGPLR